jgi:hypothetical protein
MTSACRPLTAWRHLAALLCAAAPLVSGPAEAQPCTTCARTSLGLAPRAYPAGHFPVAAAAADLDGDGRADLVVANDTGIAAERIRVLLGGPHGFEVAGTYGLSSAPRGVAIADFDTDGRPDVVVANGGQAQVLRNIGGGNLTPLVALTAGASASAVVVGDFDANGTSDVAAASDSPSQVVVFLGNGNGGFDGGHVTPVGASPRALVAGRLDAGTSLDLALACAATDQVRVLKGNGDGTFTTGPVLGVGDEPVSVAAADLEPDGDLDLVTANNFDGTVSILRNDGTGVFTLAVPSPVVGDRPTGVAVLQVDGNTRPDIVISNSMTSRSVDLLLDDGGGGFQAASRHYVLMGPQAVVPVDADADGRLDLAVPCRGSDAVVVLVAGPPDLRAAAHYTVGTQPVAAVAARLDANSDLDLAVVNSEDATVSILLNNGSGSFTPFGTALPVETNPRAIVAGDFDGDGLQDLAVSSNETGSKVSLLRGMGGGSFGSAVGFGAGSGLEGLVALDVDGDGDLDLLVCNNVASGQVAFLRNTSTPGSISFASAQFFAVGPAPISVFAGRLNADAFIDLAVANSTASSSVTVLYGDSLGHFDAANPRVLNLAGGDDYPTSVTGADFDGDGDIDLAATVLVGTAVSVFRNDGTSFAQPPTRIPAADAAVHAAAADLNFDGTIDLAIAATGLEVLRGQGSVASFEPGEDFVAGFSPVHVVAADFSGDGHPDLAVVNRDSSDVSILLGTGCTARRLELTQQPAEAACLTGLGPFNLQAVVEARDDGGNLACPVADVTASIVPNTGEPGASLTGTANSPPSVTLALGVASFTGTTNSLTLDKPGRRYQLRFSLPSLPGVPPVISHTFTLGAQPVILGPASFCPGSQGIYAADLAEGSYDEYRWTLDAAPSPFAFTPSIVLQDPLSVGTHTLALEARVDSCTLSADPRTVWYRSWLKTTLSANGPTTVCVDCLGGTVKAEDQGGGAVVSRQWGYRTTSGAGQPVTPIVGETAGSYVVKGTDFPRPGRYHLVVATGFTCPTTPPSVSDELVIDVSAEVQTSEVQFLAVTSRGTSSVGEHLLQWVNATGTPDEICIRWNEAPDSTSNCTFPTVPDCPSADGPSWHRIVGAPPTSWSHGGVTLDRNVCYAVFVRDGTNAPPWSPGRVVKARAFDAESGPVKWAYSTGATAVVPPTVGPFGILAMSNDRTVHAVTRGSAGGTWPAGWTPQALSGVVHSRSPVVPFGSGLATLEGKSVLFVADDTGVAQAVDIQTGQALWGTPGSDFAGGSARVTGAPGAILKQYGGAQDLILVGTRSKDHPTNASGFFGLDPSTGSLTITFDGGGTLGPVLGSPAVDYSTQKVYFTSWQLDSGPTVWCLQVSSSAVSPCAGWASPSLDDFDTSPVVRKGRVYVANDTVYSLDAATGGDARTFPTGDGLVKGFVFPDRDGDDLFFASNTRVWSVPDTCVSPCTMTPNWVWTDEPSPSLVLLWREQRYLYVGGSNGRLWQLNLAYSPGHPSFARSRTLGDGRGQIGAPSIDIGVTPRLLIVGSESGVLYGVEVPF